MIIYRNYLLALISISIVCFLIKPQDSPNQISNSVEFTLGQMSLTKKTPDLSSSNIYNQKTLDDTIEEFQKGVINREDLFKFFGKIMDRNPKLLLANSKFINQTSPIRDVWIKACWDTLYISSTRGEIIKLYSKELSEATLLSLDTINLDLNNFHLIHFLLKHSNSSFQREIYTDLLEKMRSTAFNAGLTDESFEHTFTNLRTLNSNDADYCKMIDLLQFTSDMERSTALLSNVNRDDEQYIDRYSEAIVNNNPTIGLGQIKNLENDSLRRKFITKVIKKWLREDSISTSAFVLESLSGLDQKTAISEIITYLEEAGSHNEAEQWRSMKSE